MRWIVAGCLALAIGWSAYLGSPYWALYRLGRAVEAGNVAELASRVNIRALRGSVARQVATQIAAIAQPTANGIASSDAQLAASAAAILADPFLDAYLQPDGVMRVLSGVKDEGGDPAIGPGKADGPAVRRFLAASAWRGFRNVYFSLPPGAPPPMRYRLQLRLSQFRWRLVGLELPPDLVHRIAGEIAEGRRP